MLTEIKEELEVAKARKHDLQESFAATWTEKCIFEEALSELIETEGVSCCQNDSSISELLLELNRLRSLAYPFGGRLDCGSSSFGTDSSRECP